MFEPPSITISNRREWLYGRALGDLLLVQILSLSFTGLRLWRCYCFHQALALLDHYKLVYRHVPNYLCLSSRPSDFNRIDSGFLAETEMKSSIVLGDITSSAVDLFDLNQLLRFNFNLCSQRVTVPF